MPKGPQNEFFGLDMRKFDEEWEDSIRRLKERNRRLSSLRPIMIRVGQFLRYETIRNFDSEGAHGGRKWASNAPAYASWKRGERSGGVGGSVNPASKDARVLHRFLNLRRALTVKAHPDHVEHVSEKGRRLTIGLRKGSWVSELARIHRAGGRIPVRDPFKFNRNADRTALKLVEDYIRTGEIPPAASL